jgi:regulator of ribonuclease activity B
VALGQLFQTIDYEGEAHEVIKAITGWFYWLAGLNAVLGLAFFDLYGLVAGALYFGVAFWFRSTQSRLASVVTLFVAALLLYVAITSIIPSIIGIVLRISMLGLSLRGVEAAFKLYRLTASKAATAVASRPSGAGGRPSLAEAMAADAEILKQLKKAGANLSKPHFPEFLFDFPTEAAAQEAVAKIKQIGFDADVPPPMPGRQWPVRAQKSMVLSEDAMKRARYQFDRIARAGGGTYLGWGAPAVS